MRAMSCTNSLLIMCRQLPVQQAKAPRCVPAWLMATRSPLQHLAVSPSPSTKDRLNQLISPIQALCTAGQPGQLVSSTGARSPAAKLSNTTGHHGRLQAR